MFEVLAANMTFSPALIAMALAIALPCFIFEWVGKGAGVKRREEALKRDVFESKRSIPQLESGGKRDQQIARLEIEVQEPNDRTTELHGTLQAKETELRSATRNARER